MIEIVVPAPDRHDSAGVATPRAAFDGRLGVLDNSKPRFGLLARAAIARLGEAGIEHDSSLYVRKPIAGQPADPADLDRLASGAVAVLVGSGD
ncbi:MAG TPA: hypothetical protein VHC01_01195 [Gaiellaceae bacterium]|jgi:hypothetical protein|nr:hypothetical protein [Gaiellaceae bacterium]